MSVVQAVDVGAQTKTAPGASLVELMHAHVGSSWRGQNSVCCCKCIRSVNTTTLTKNPSESFVLSHVSKSKILWCIPYTMRITETFSADCRSSTIVLDNKPHCNGSSTLTAFDPATGVAKYVHYVKDHVKGHSAETHLTWDFRGGTRDTTSRHSAGTSTDHLELVR
jgi:hypothetical protein